MQNGRGKGYREFRERLVKDDKKREAEIQLEAIKLDLAQLLFGYREKSGLTQRLLAEKMGVRQQVVSKIESGSSNITLETLIKFLNILGVVFKVDHAKRKRAEKVLQFLPICLYGRLIFF